MLVRWFWLLLLIALPALLSSCAGYSKVKTLSISSVTVTAEQKALAKELATLSDQPEAYLGRLLDAAYLAQADLAGVPKDTLFLADYNYAVARILDRISDGKDAPWDEPLICPSSQGEPWKLRFVPFADTPKEVARQVNWDTADRLSFKGELVGERIIKKGLGAPVVGQAADTELQQEDDFVPDEIFYGLTGVLEFDGANATLAFYDPLNRETVPFNGTDYPLAADFQAPLALSLARLNPKRTELAGFFNPAKVEHTARLTRLQPYQAEKIPVLCIHGLGNSPATWMPLIDFLRGDEEIRKQYQFWFFSYPTGLPYPIAAAQLREKLDTFNERYPDHRDLVVVGHSMGGMISRLLITDSDMVLWDTFYEAPPEEMPFHPQTREVLSEALIFEPSPNIDRVVFVSASHRGSYDSTSFIGRLGARIVGDPIAETEISHEAVALANPNANSQGLKRLPNSIDILNPDSRFLQVVNALPTAPGIPYHSLIGDRGKGGNLDRTKPQSSDGIVPYWSSHMDEAESELVIPSGHWSHLHPMGMAEIKRILLLHAKSLNR